jgi:hypothetical protein
MKYKKILVNTWYSSSWGTTYVTELNHWNVIGTLYDSDGIHKKNVLTKGSFKHYFPNVGDTHEIISAMPNFHSVIKSLFVDI